MEDLSRRVPMVNRLILRNLNDRTLVSFNGASREINQVLDNEKFYWIRMMNKYNGNFKEFQGSWRKVISKTPVNTVKQLALAVDKFFKDRSTHYKKQWFLNKPSSHR